MCIMKHTTNVMRFNITLPSDVGAKLKTKKNRSSLIADTLRQKFEAEEKEQLAKVLKEGYMLRAAEDKALAKDFEHTLTDGL